MASEDSDEFMPGLAPVHRLRYLDDVRKTGRHEVSSFVHQFYATRELVEVGSLCRPKWISSKERNDRLSELSAIGHDVLA